MKGSCSQHPAGMWVMKLHSNVQQLVLQPPGFEFCTLSREYSVLLQFPWGPVYSPTFFVPKKDGDTCG